jgi:hypothetical protein
VLFLSIESAEEFAGTDRFAIERRLGAGGFGVVYRAYDRKRTSVVALKTLRRAEADALYRFKQEFRSLADISHPNLVALYELLSEAEQWFFTMELVDGVNFLEHVRALPLRSEDSGMSTLRAALSEGARTPSPVVGSSGAARGLLRLGLGASAGARPPPATCEARRLRVALQQLGEGLHALHEAGKLHRDIKPSNVLVTHEGRVVLLDFGLVSDLGPEGFLHSIHLVGTPAYMSPEQAAGRPVTEASDWYGVGVMLYEALTGMRPFPGEFLDVLVQKQQAEPPAPSDLVTGVPEDLDALCRGLLRKEPQERPAASEILGLLRSAAPGREEHLARAAPRAAPFVGREAHLAELALAFERTQKGGAVAVTVRGSSGIGKTALVRRFLEEVKRREPGAVVLSGRSYEQETVPYKALDSLVDALAQYLQRLPQAEAEALLPRDVLALARLFPVLRQVEAVALARRRVVPIPDSLEQRRRGFRALRELFGRIADAAALVLFIDDLQWGDADSAALLSELLRPPDPPPLLLVGCFRVEADSDNALWTTLLGLRSSASPELEVRELIVGELAEREAEELAVALLETQPRFQDASARSIARESRGNPFFIDELARHVREGAELKEAESSPAGEPVHLDDVIWARASWLPHDARRLLETVAVAGQPIDRAVARRAAGIVEDDQPAIALLRVGHWIRGAGVESEDQIEIYHDRIRQTVVARLSAQDRETAHQRLAFALESSSLPDPETLAIHYQGGGSKERAAVYAADAAVKAAEALAFDRAARLYKLALELGTVDASVRQRLRVSLGDALANAGRGAEAAHAYLAAAEEASATETLELQRRAAEQLLRSGRVDEGLAVLRRVLERIGMRLSSTPRGAVLSFLLRRLQLLIRGLSFRERAATEIPAEDLVRIDTCWSVATGLSMIDTIRGREFQARHVLLALEAGEPYRVARAMANEGGYNSLAGWPARHRTRRLVDRAMLLAEKVRHPYALGHTYLGASVAAYMEGRWETGWELFQRCEEIFREQCTGVTWELDTAHVVAFRSLTFLGRLRELSERLPRLLKEASERDDLFATTSLQTRYGWVVNLMADEPGRARRQLRAAADAWSHQGFHLQHYFQLVGETDISLYQGSGLVAWENLVERWAGLERSLLRRRVQLFRIETHHLRARAALAAAASSSLSAPHRRDLLGHAVRDAKRIEREKTPWGDPLAALLRAGIASVRGERANSLTALAAAESGFDMTKMALYAAATRRCRGLLLGGGEGHALVESADAWMRAERIKNPDRMTAMLAPGRWTVD